MSDSILIRPPADLQPWHAPVSVSGDAPTPLPGARSSLALLARNWRFVLCLVVAGAALGIAVSLFATPIYEATATLELQDTNADFLNLRSLDPNAPASQVTIDKYVDTQVKILESRNLIAAVLENAGGPPPPPAPGLMRRLLQTTHLRDVRWADYLPARFAPWLTVMPPTELAIEDARASLKVRAAATSRTVDITYSHIAPLQAANFANAIAAEYIQQNGLLRTDSARKTDEFLSARARQLRTRLEQLERELELYSHSAGLLLTAEKDNVAEEKLRQIQVELSRAQADRTEKQARSETASAADADSVPEVLDSKALTDYRARLAELNRQSAEMNGIFTPSHYKVQRLKVQIDELTATAARERANILSRVRNDFDSASRREALLRATYATQLAVVTDQSSRTVRYKMLKREVDTTRQIYEDMLRKAQDANVGAAIRPNSIRVVDPAVPPSRPATPRLGLNTIAGAFSGLWIALLFLFFRFRAGATFREPGDTSSVLDAPELGAIPSVKFTPAGASGLGSFFGRVRPFRQGQLSVVPSRESQSVSIELLSWTEKPSPVAESFRAALTSLQFLHSDDSGAKVIVLTSPSAGDGKTTVLTNLGIALGESGRSVLLIDCDLRQPRLHSIFSVPNNWGVTDLLSGAMAFSQTPLDTLVRATSIPGVSVLPSGPGTANISALLKSPRVGELLSHLSTRFDTILIDTPPMTYISDARVLARKGDGVVLVLKANRTSRDLALSCVQRLKLDGSVLMGTILNDWDRASSPQPYEEEYFYGQAI